MINTEAYSKLSNTCKMMLFGNIINTSKPLTIFRNSINSKNSILDACLGSCSGCPLTYVPLACSLIKQITEISQNMLAVTYRVCGLRLGPNFAMRLAADKNIYLWLTVEEMHAFADFNGKYL